MIDSKYVVFKREDFDRWKKEIPPSWVQEIEDATVIRSQDIFAMSGLWAYANNITTFLELHQAFLLPMSEEERTNLEGIRDYFITRADEARRKLLSGDASLPT